ncbi:MAG TPA: WecB/TagA/CpsF family glycosyltransferase [Humisphaera sp.]|nr:WecB/TagA/CpsF family glycosyltransferase [Humisphaera sp.]
MTAPGPSPALMRLPAVDLLGVKVHAITEADCVTRIIDELNANRGGIVVTPNLDHLRRYLSDVNFGALVAEADLVVADGMPLVWASRLQGTPLPERVAGSNLISSLSASAATTGKSVFLLGGSPGSAEGAARVLQTRYPALKVVGYYFPPVGFEHDSKEIATIIEVLSAAKPDIVYVALGSPKQERLIAKVRNILPNAWWLGVGNSFSFLCGDVRRAPLWMQKIGLEWVHRLMQEPRRLFRRYIVVGIPFASRLLSRSLARGVANRFAPRPVASVAENNATTKTPAQPLPVVDVAPLVTTAVASLEPQVIRGVWNSSSDVDRADEAAPFSKLRSMVLLGGSVRANALVDATGRSVLDLPLDENGSVLNFWLRQAVEVARSIHLEKLPVRVMVDQHSPEPASADPAYLGTFRVERDLSEYRGTGGVLHDLGRDYQDDDLILVANAAQILLDPLPVILAALRRKRADVAVISHEDGTPSGMMLLTCKVLRMLPVEGFFDMKEQGLPLIASKYDVRAIRRRRPTGLPIRNLEGYIQGLHYYHRRRSGAVATIDPLAEDWGPSFSLIEPGASVADTARVHDSVVLAGARVEAGAVLVRALIGPGAVVRRDQTAVDQIVALHREPRKRFRTSADDAAVAR